MGNNRLQLVVRVIKYFGNFISIKTKRETMNSNRMQNINYRRRDADIEPKRKTEHSGNFQKDWTSQNEIPWKSYTRRKVFACLLSEETVANREMVFY